MFKKLSTFDNIILPVYFAHNYNTRAEEVPIYFMFLFVVQTLDNFLLWVSRPYILWYVEPRHSWCLLYFFLILSKLKRHLFSSFSNCYLLISTHDHNNRFDNTCKICNLAEVLRQHSLTSYWLLDGLPRHFIRLFIFSSTFCMLC
jgi:hypothetical protein